MNEAFWLRQLFTCAADWPWLLRAMRPIAKHGVPIAVPRIESAVRKNSLRLLGNASTLDACDVVASFYDFITDIAASQHASADDLRSRIATVEGRKTDSALRNRQGGAVLVTAHMGSFEVGLAALSQIADEIHVVFKRDANDQFESLRRRTRQTLGVHEAAIDDGWPTLINLRDRLNAGAIVVMQGDRAMPSQKSQCVPFAHGHLRLPLGPLRLAQITGSPIVPVFTVRQPDGTFRVLLRPAINAADDDALEQLAAVMAREIARHAEQWLVLEPAFVEDAKA